MKQINQDEIAEVAGGVIADPETGRGCTEHGPLFPQPFNPLPGKFERANGTLIAL